MVKWLTSPNISQKLEIVNLGSADPCVCRIHGTRGLGWKRPASLFSSTSLTDTCWHFLQLCTKLAQIFSKTGNFAIGRHHRCFVVMVQLLQVSQKFICSHCYFEITIAVDLRLLLFVPALMNKHVCCYTEIFDN